MIRLRKMTDSDCERVAALEAALFSDGWSEATLRDFLQGEYNVGYALVSQEGLAAYALLQCFEGEGELLRIGTHPTDQRQGFAEKLLRHAIADGKAKSVFLEVRSQNEGARRLYEKLGFSPIGCRKGYYKAPADDAVLYQLRLNQK